VVGCWEKGLAIREEGGKVWPPDLTWGGHGPSPKKGKGARPLSVARTIFTIDKGEGSCGDGKEKKTKAVR